MPGLIEIVSNEIVGYGDYEMLSLDDGIFLNREDGHIVVCGCEYAIKIGRQ